MENSVQELEYFYNDGLKDCSWIPDSFDEFLVYCSTKELHISNESLLITSGDNDFRYIDTIYVIKSRRNEGIATALINKLQGRLALLCNAATASFYKKLGFTDQLPYKILIKEK